MALTMAAVVFAIALYLRTGAFAGGSIDWDEADYAVAAFRGVWANWRDQSEALNGQLRHWHAPFSIYLIALSTSAFGFAEWSVRLPGVFASAAACAAIALAGVDLADGSFRMRLTAGGIAGVLLATAPASVGQTQTATPHSIVELLLVLNVWCLARYLRAPSTKGAVWFGISLGAQFVTMEYGFIVTGFAGVAVALAATLRSGRTRTTVRERDIVAGVVAVGAVTLALWPAGLLKAGVVQNLLYYIRYAREGFPLLFRGELYLHVPRWAYLWWYWQDFPTLLVALLTGLLLLGVWAYRTRGAIPIVLAVFALGLLASIHTSHIMGLKYSVFAIPPVVLGGVLAGAWGWRVLFHAEGRMGRLPRALYTTALLAIVARVAAGGVTALSPSVHASEAKLLAVRTVPLLPSGARVIANPLPILRYVAYLEQRRLDVQFVDFAPNDARREAQSLKRLEAGDAEWAYVRIPAGGVGESPVFKFLNARFVLADQEGNLRLYRTPPR